MQSALWFSKKTDFEWSNRQQSHGFLVKVPGVYLRVYRSVSYGHLQYRLDTDAYEGP